ncbi:hypothetical protein [Novosphingobium sp. MBES04]|uniref:hypothetical protein n=1 Tax=Novosphingobium sp. MBES04 TaxID=1206458 RepID=UPI001187100C|nr:hypothetical protein [Novosphingobium sp. MBES04]
MKKVILLAALCASCEQQQPASNDAAVIDAKVTQVPSGPPKCTMAMAAKPPRPSGFKEIQSMPPATLCEGSSNEKPDSPHLTMDGLDLNIGDPVAGIADTVLRSGGKVAQTFAGKAYVFEQLVPPPPAERSVTSDPEKRVRRYWINSENGKITGFRRCDQYQNTDTAEIPGGQYASFAGPPESMKTFAEGGFTLGLVTKWANGSEFRISGGPNIARLDVGKIPEAFSWSDRTVNTKMMREMIRREDRMDREVARQSISFENCLSSDELQAIIVPLLEDGVSVDE